MCVAVRGLCCFSRFRHLYQVAARIFLQRTHMFEVNISHGGGFNEHISVCKEKNLKKMAIIVPFLLQHDINDPSCGKIFVEHFKQMLKLKFVVVDLATMTSEAWLKDNMPAIKASLALMPDPRKHFRGFIPLIVTQARELCVCLVELNMLLICEDVLESPVDKPGSYRNNVHGLCYGPTPDCLVLSSDLL